LEREYDLERDLEEEERDRERDLLLEEERERDLERDLLLDLDLVTPTPLSTLATSSSFVAIFEYKETLYLLFFFCIVFLHTKTKISVVTQVHYYYKFY